MSTPNTSAFAFECLRYSDKPQSLSKALYGSPDGMAEKAFISSEGEWRFRYDGEEPSSEEGHLLRDGCFIILLGELQISRFRALSLENDSKLSISYERK